MDVYNTRGNYQMADSVVNEALAIDSLNEPVSVCQEHRDAEHEEV